MKINLNIFKNKTVIITGHTGFKGSWLTIWMTLLGAKVVGVSNKVLTKPSNYQANNLKNKIKNYFFNIEDQKKLTNLLLKYKPDFIFHLAAQALVSESFLKSKITFKTNAIGTLNLLEALRNYNTKKKCSVVIITSDKSYRNLELNRGYKENDILGGHDPYSASKACAELIIQSYFKSFLQKNKFIKISVARAGNVIGGGDWSKDRLIPDCIKSIVANKNIFLRFPNSTRPWQHVLEAIYGYMSLSILQLKKKELNGQAFNFGPNNKNSVTVLDLVKKIKLKWKRLNWKIINNKKSFYESKLLKLNSKKAKKYLGWKCYLNSNQTIDWVINWYKYFYDNNKKNMYDFSIKQIKEYDNIIKKK